MSHIDSPPKESFGPVIASLDHPLSASRKEGIVFVCSSSSSFPLAEERDEQRSAFGVSRYGAMLWFNEVLKDR